MKSKDEIKLRVGDNVTCKLITKNVVSGKVVRREGKIMLSCKEVFYHLSSIEEVLK
jgi:ribosomal protein L36